MSEITLASITIRASDDVLAAIGSARQIGASLGFLSAERAHVCLAATSAALTALESQGTLQYSRTPDALRIRLVGSSESTFTFPIHAESLAAEQERLALEAAPSAGLEQEVRALLDASVLARKQIESSKLMVAALEAELEETNRGVLALYAELDDRADKLRRADVLKSQFLSYASHELRTPLNGIVGLVRMLMSRAEPRAPEENKQLAFIKSAAEEMREMVNDLLDLAKVEAGKVTVTPSAFDLDFVFGALRGMFRPLLQTDETLLIFGDTSAVPPIYSDEGKVSQILRNFISNALKFTERGEVHVWAILEGDLLRISVKDTGVGISPEHLPKIFDEFSQIENPLQKRTKGTGLGLPLCKKLAELLGGSIEVESQVEKGSTFTLVLPPKYEARVGFGERLAPPVKVKLPKLLIIDDMEIDRYLLMHLLNSGGTYEIIQAVDGQLGLDSALRDLPDMIFLDLNMPRLDGFTVLSALRENTSTSQIPVVVVTARSFSEEELAHLQEQALAVLSKETLSGAERIMVQIAPTPNIRVLPVSEQSA